MPRARFRRPHQVYIVDCISFYLSVDVLFYYLFSIFSILDSYISPIFFFAYKLNFYLTQDRKIDKMKQSRGLFFHLNFLNYCLCPHQSLFSNQSSMWACWSKICLIQWTVPTSDPWGYFPGSTSQILHFCPLNITQSHFISFDSNNSFVRTIPSVSPLLKCEF